MNPNSNPNADKFTPKTNKALAGAHNLAITSGHDEITILHLASDLLSDHNGIFFKAISIVGGKDSSIAVQRALTQELKKLPSKSPPRLDEVYCSTDLMPVIRGSQDPSKKSHPGIHFAVDKLIVGVLEDARIAAIFKGVGVGVSKVISEVGYLSGKSVKEPVLGFGDTVYLKTYGVDLCEEALEKLAPVIGRGNEIRDVVNTLTQHTKNNPILVGEPGVGKTAVVEGLAQRIVKGDVPPSLADVRVISLDMGKLVSGTMFRGDFEERLKGVMKEAEEADGKIIIFIDEIHTVLGAGTSLGRSMDAANLMKPFLARGIFPCIGATTLDEYKKYVEKDEAFQRRFEKIIVEEPTVPVTINILRGLQQSLESRYAVQIQDRALVDAVVLSTRYVSGGRRPDKAISLLVKTCTSIRAQLDTQPDEIDNLTREKMELDRQLYALENKKDYTNNSRLLDVRREIDDLIEKIEHLKVKRSNEKERINGIQRLERILEDLHSELLKAESQQDEATVFNLKYGTIKKVEEELKNLEERTDGQGNDSLILTATVGPDQIAEVVSQLTGIPVNRLSQMEIEKLNTLGERLHDRVVGQEKAVNAVVEVVLQSRYDVGTRTQPIGSFLFLGPTGVGKTELALALAEQLFDDQNNLVQLDMSEYKEEHSVTKLIGASPGQAGHAEGGQLTEKIKRRPYSVVLFDEVEKAHVDVFDTLLQVLGQGRLTDGCGVTVDFKNTIIIMTSNLGADYLLDGLSGKCTMETARNQAIEAARRHFRREFVMRLDEMVVFDPLSREELRKITQLQMKDVANQFAEKGITLVVTDAALDYILAQSYDPENGARPIRKWIKKKVAMKLVTMLMRKEIVDNSTVCLDVGPPGSDLTYCVGKHGLGEKSDLLTPIPKATESDAVDENLNPEV